MSDSDVVCDIWPPSITKSIRRAHRSDFPCESDRSGDTWSVGVENVPKVLGARYVCRLSISWFSPQGLKSGKFREFGHCHFRIGVVSENAEIT